MATIASKSSLLRENSDSSCAPTAARPGAAAAPPDGAARELVHWFKLLADETRLRIVLLLLEHRELNVRSLCDVLDLSQPAVSHHLALLRADGLIECRRDGKHNYYRLLPQRFGDLMGKILAAVPGNEPVLRLGNVHVSWASVSEMTPEERP